MYCSIDSIFVYRKIKLAKFVVFWAKTQNILRVSPTKWWGGRLSVWGAIAVCVGPAESGCGTVQQSTGSVTPTEQQSFWVEFETIERPNKCVSE